MKAKICGMALGLASVAFLGAASMPAHAQDSSDEDRATAARLVYGLMSSTRYAYRPHPLDDALSSRIFDAYVEALDPEGLRFDPADLQALEKHRHKLDTAIKRGALAPIYEIADARANPGGEQQDRDEIFELFLNAYARASDGDGSYRSPFVEAATTTGPAGADEPRPSVGASVVEAGGERVGVIVVPHLYSTRQRMVSAEVAKAIDRFNRDGIEALVLDLRGNGGGALREVVEVAGLLLGRGPVMQVREAGGRVSVESAKAARRWHGRLGVLVDAGTAAGAEMLAAALQDHGRGIVLGEPTFGRGTIQNPVSLDVAPDEPRRYGVLSFTIAEVFRLNGQPLDGVGITPDRALALDTVRKGRGPRGAVSRAIAAVDGFEQAPRDFGPVDLVVPPRDASLEGSAADPTIAEAALIVQSLADFEPDALAGASLAARLDRYARALQAHVVSQWVYSESALNTAPCKAHVTQLPGGTVIAVAIDRDCPENPALRHSIESAIIKASPLPYAGFEDVFTRKVTMNFKAEPGRVDPASGASPVATP